MKKNISLKKKIKQNMKKHGRQEKNEEIYADPETKVRIDEEFQNISFETEKAREAELEQKLDKFSRLIELGLFDSKENESKMCNVTVVSDLGSKVETNHTESESETDKGKHKFMISFCVMLLFIILISAGLTEYIIIGFEASYPKSGVRDRVCAKNSVSSNKFCDSKFI